MTIEADNRPPGVGGPSKDVILSAAIKVARRGGMHDFRSASFTAHTGSEPGPPYDVVRLRTWCSLVVLDRFDGFSSGCQASIELRDVVLPSNLLQLVGDNLHYLLRTYPSSSVKSSLLFRAVLTPCRRTHRSPWPHLWPYLTYQRRTHPPSDAPRKLSARGCSSMA